MNQYELETKIEGLKKAIAEHSDFTNNYKSDLAKAEQQLKDLLAKHNSKPNYSYYVDD